MGGSILLFENPWGSAGWCAYKYDRDTGEYLGVEINESKMVSL